MNVASLFSSIRPNKVLLLLGSVLGSVACIVLHNAGALPLDGVTFLFFSFVFFLFALYRPGWVFLLFVGVLPLEIINLAPAVLGGIALRPYQWLTGILLVAVLTRFLFKRLPFEIFRPRFLDLLPVLVAVGAFLSVMGAPVPSLALKQALVVASFVAIYFLGRIFFRTLFDMRQAVPFFLGSSLVVSGYALWQNIRFSLGQESFQVMTGRPNATLSEADWLGMFVVLVISILYMLLAFSVEQPRKKTFQDILKSTLFSVLLTLTFIVLIITVARSAWLGALALTIVFSLGLLFKKSLKRSWQPTLIFGGILSLSLLVALGAVLLFHLSPFQFLNRIQSTGSGLQKITVACESDVTLPEKVAHVDDLSAFGCRHIDLEAIESEQGEGKFVKEVFRDDPNVSIRKEIYGKSWDLIRAHPFLGIGWGSAALFLGNDERGAGLNASNIFLEVWLGSGLLGLMAFSLFWFSLMYASFYWYRASGSETERLFGLFFLSSIIGITVFDLFNSGILLGFFFLFLSLGALPLEQQEARLCKKFFRKEAS